jgi:hypothetical protein
VLLRLYIEESRLGVEEERLDELVEENEEEEEYIEEEEVDREEEEEVEEDVEVEKTLEVEGRYRELVNLEIFSPAKAESPDSLPVSESFKISSFSRSHFR